MTNPQANGHLTKVIFPVCIIAIILISCGKGNLDQFDCAGFEPTYSAEIKPILDGSCAISGCHNATSAQGGINLSNYTSASTESKNDRFLGAIQHKKGYAQMPEDSPKLSLDKIELLSCWVQTGSQE